MKKVFNFKKEVEIEDNISSITSISLDTTFSESANLVEGTFVVEGNYKTHELSLNKKEFKYSYPFQEEIPNLISDSANLEVIDFTYDLDGTTLILDIDYEITYEENIADEFDEAEFTRFLEDHEVDIVDLTAASEEEPDEPVNETDGETQITEVADEKTEEREEKPSVIEPEISREEGPTEEQEEASEENNNPRDIIITPTSESEATSTSIILDNLDKEEKYITYHVYICTVDDTIDSIAEKFKTTKEEIREYNEIDDIEYGRKLIIPVSNE